LPGNRLWTVEEWISIVGGERTFELVRPLRNYRRARQIFPAGDKRIEIWEEHEQLILCVAIIYTTGYYRDPVYRAFDFRRLQLADAFRMNDRTGSNHLPNAAHRITTFRNAIRNTAGLTEVLREIIERRLAKHRAALGETR
jgi:hypothetical protein